MEKTKKIKIKIFCPLCNKNLVKQYFSQHMRKQHKNSNYCKFTRKGMSYNIFHNIKINNNLKGKFFCKICNKSMNNYSKYKHLKTKMHIFLYKNSNRINKGISAKETIKEKKCGIKEIGSLENNDRFFNENISSTHVNHDFTIVNPCINYIKKENENNINKNIEIKELMLESRTIRSDDFYFTESDNNSYSSFSLKKEDISSSSYSKSDSDSSSSSCFHRNVEKRKEMLWGPDAYRIKKEIDEVIEKIEKKKTLITKYISIILLKNLIVIQIYIVILIYKSYIFFNCLTKIIKKSIIEFYVFQ